MSTAPSPVWVAGADTLLGRALSEALDERGAPLPAAPHPDVADRAAVDAFLARERPRCVLMAAGRSAGIHGNLRAPAELFLDNVTATVNVLEAARAHGVERLLYFASSCVYPKGAPQPMTEDRLWTGPLEPTSEAYAVAKLAGLEMCDAYRRQWGCRFLGVIPGDLFGPGDRLDEDAHVAGALLRRMHEAKRAGASEVVVWGTGAPRRDFLYAKDAADGALFLMDRWDGDGPVNLGSGASVSIAELAELLARVVGFEGALRFDASKPDGAPFKALDSSRIQAMGWRPRTALESALRETYAWFVTTEEGRGGKS